MPYAALRPIPERSVRLEGISPQRADATCGLAALATVLAFLGEPTDEEQLRLLSGLPPGQPASLRHLVVAAAQLGYPAFAVRSSWARMESYFREFAEPVVVLLKGSLPHFSVWLAADPRVAYLADPIRGHLALARRLFESRWTGVALLVRPAPAAGASRLTGGAGPGALDGDSALTGGVAAALRRAVDAGRQRHRGLSSLQARSGWEVGRP